MTENDGVKRKITRKRQNNLEKFRKQGSIRNNHVVDSEELCEIQVLKEEVKVAKTTE